MKSLFLTLATVFLSVFSISSQTIEGTYTNQWQSNSGEGIAYILTLNENGSFTFQSTRSFLESIPDKTVEAKGTWKLDGYLLLLKTEENTNELSSKLNMNRARYIATSPRNPQFNLVKPSFKFYKSEVFYAKDMELFKTESSLTSSH